jgi:hypothetical protein
MWRARDQCAECSAAREPGRGWPAPAIFRHSAAQRRQASAQRWQCSMWGCFSHSCAHSSQTSAQSWQNSAARSLPRAITMVAVRQISAHSRSSAMQRASIFTSCSFKQAVAQCSHSIAHSLQASMQLRMVSCVMGVVSSSFKKLGRDQAMSRRAVTGEPQGGRRRIRQFVKRLSARPTVGPPYQPFGWSGTALCAEKSHGLKRRLTLDHSPAFRLRCMDGSEAVWT